MTTYLSMKTMTAILHKVIEIHCDKQMCSAGTFLFVLETIRLVFASTAAIVVLIIDFR